MSKLLTSTYAFQTCDSKLAVHLKKNVNRDFGRYFSTQCWPQLPSQKSPDLKHFRTKYRRWFSLLKYPTLRTRLLFPNSKAPAMWKHALYATDMSLVNRMVQNAREFEQVPYRQLAARPSRSATSTGDFESAPNMWQIQKNQTSLLMGVRIIHDFSSPGNSKATDGDKNDTCWLRAYLYNWSERK